MRIRYEEDTSSRTVEAAAAFELAHADEYDDELPPSPAELDDARMIERIFDAPDAA